ncbi:MAG: efflux RND transporter periplasmic adaptor subunit [Holophagaceae bacterium]|nr:efflux RND transporter periplasmic adaptor subunit [Holophagaceae bacterium]
MSNPALIFVSALLLGSGPARAALPVEGLVLPFRQVEVAAPVSSRITDMKVKEGEAVKEGQSLALLYGRLEELEAQRAKVLLERREFEAKGARKLYESRVIPEARALEARIDLDLARLQYETAVEQVRLRTILAPMDGIVVMRAHDAGEAVSTAQPLFRILDLSKVVVQVEVEPRQLAAVLPGRRVRVSFPLADQPCHRGRGDPRGSLRGRRGAGAREGAGGEPGTPDPVRDPGGGGIAGPVPQP